MHVLPSFMSGQLESGMMLLDYFVNQRRLRNYYIFIHGLTNTLEARILEPAFVLGYYSFVEATLRCQIHNIQPVIQRFNYNKQFDADACCLH
jgi:hypothetical protein